MNLHPIFMQCSILGMAFSKRHDIYTKKWTRTWADLGIPSPPCVTVFGNFLQIKRMGGLRASVRAWVDDYGKKFGFHIGKQPVIVVADGTTAEEVLENGEEAFCPVFDLPSDLRKELGGNCLSLSKDVQWDSLHYIMATVFCSENLNYMVPRLNRCANILGEYFEDISTDVQANQLRFSVTELATSYSYDALAAMLIGEELDHFSGVKHPFFTALQTMFKSAKTDYNGITVSSKMSGMRKYFEERIEERKPHAQKEAMVDFLDIFTHAGSTTMSSATNGLQFPKYAMTPAEIVGSLMHWVLHGHSTMVSALQFVLHMLASFPDHQQLIFAEIGKNIINEEPNFEELSKLKFMDLVIKEVLRILSPVQEIWRQAKTEIQTEDLTIPAHAEILIPNFIIHSDNEYFFEPDLFEPERYLAKASEHRSELFLAFGSGPRTCIGYELALLQLKMALVHIVRKVKLTRAPSEYNIHDSYLQECQIKAGLSVTDEGILRPMKPLRLLMEPRRPQDVFKLKPKPGAQTATTGAGGKEMDMLKDKSVHFNRGGSAESSRSPSPSTISSPANSTTSGKSSKEFSPSLDDLPGSEESKAGTAKSKSDQFFDAVENDSKVEQGHLTAAGEASDEGDKKKKKKKKKGKSEGEDLKEGSTGGSKTKLAEKASASEIQEDAEGADGKKKKKKKKKKGDDSGPAESGGEHPSKSGSKEAVGEEGSKKKKKKKKGGGFLDDSGPAESGGEHPTKSGSKEAVGEEGSKKKKKKKKGGGFLDDSGHEEAGGEHPTKSGSKEAVGEEGSKKKKKKKKGGGFLDDSGHEEAGGEHPTKSGSKEAVGEEGSKKKKKKKGGYLDDKDESEPQSVVSQGASSTGLTESEGGKEKKKKKKKHKGADGAPSGENLAATSGDEAAPGEEGGEKKKKKKKKDKDGEKSGDAPATSGDDAGEEGGKKKKKKGKSKDGEKSGDEAGAPGGSGTEIHAEGEEGGEKKKKKKKTHKDGEKSGDDAGAPGGSGTAIPAEGEEGGEKKKKKKKKQKDGEKSGDDAGAPGGSGTDIPAEGEEGGEKKKKKKKKHKDGEKSGDDAGAPGGSGTAIPAEGEEGGEKKKKKKKHKDGEKSGDEVGAPGGSGTAIPAEGEEGDEKKKKKKKKKDKDGDPPEEAGDHNEGDGGEKKKKKKKKQDA